MGDTGTEVGEDGMDVTEQGDGEKGAGEYGIGEVMRGIGEEI